MATQGVAQSVRGSFVVRPDLPIGSPERHAFFGLLRQTFCEDWKEAGVALERKEREAKGDLYFIRAGGAVKIGHTTNIVARLTNMQANNHEELNCLVLLKGQGSKEGWWHKRFAKDHLRGEWFKWTPALEAAMWLARDDLQTLSDKQEG